MTAPLPNLDALAALAEKATPGPWTYEPTENGYYVLDRDGHSLMADWSEYEAQAMEPHDAAFVAACDPSTILALIARVKRAEEALLLARAVVAADDHGGSLEAGRAIAIDALRRFLFMHDTLAALKEQP